jgi:hypothetical protein
MNRLVACMLMSGAMACGAQALADDTSAATNSNNSPTLTNAHAIHKKLMKDCMDQQKAQGASVSDEAKKSCESQVKSQMEQMNNAGTVPPSSVPQRSSGNPNSNTNSGTASSSTD